MLAWRGYTGSTSASRLPCACSRRSVRLTTSAQQWQGEDPKAPDVPPPPKYNKKLRLGLHSGAFSGRRRSATGIPEMISLVRSSQKLVRSSQEEALRAKDQALKAIKQEFEFRRLAEKRIAVIMRLNGPINMRRVMGKFRKRGCPSGAAHSPLLYGQHTGTP